MLSHHPGAEYLTKICTHEIRTGPAKRQALLQVLGTQLCSLSPFQWGRQAIHEIMSDTDPCCEGLGVGDQENGYSNMVVWEGPSALVILELNSE